MIIFIAAENIAAELQLKRKCELLIYWKNYWKLNIKIFVTHIKTFLVQDCCLSKFWL